MKEDRDLLFLQRAKNEELKILIDISNSRHRR